MVYPPPLHFSLINKESVMAKQAGGSERRLWR